MFQSQAKKKGSYTHASNIISRLKAAGHQAYLVGGCVRDILRCIEPTDYDIATSARPDDVVLLFEHTVPIGAKFGVTLVIIEGCGYEVSTFRAEKNYIDGRRPSEVVFTTAKDDVMRRDFTINAILMDPETGTILDYVDGRHDIENRTVRTIGSPDNRFSEDYLRMLRAVRFAANLDYKIEPETYDSIKRNAPAIKQISAERIHDELTKIITSKGARRGMEMLEETGLLKEVLPEVAALRGIEQPPKFHPEGDVWEHILRMLDFMNFDAPDGADSRVAWSVLLHDVGKALTRTEDETGIHFYGHVREGVKISEAIMDRLRFPRAESETVIDIIRCHMFFLNIKEMRQGKLKRFLRMPNFDLHLELHRLDCLGSHGLLDNYDFCKAMISQITKEQLYPAPLLTGKDLIDLGFRPGPIFTKILRSIEDAQLDGLISTADEALKMVKEQFSNG